MAYNLVPEEPTLIVILVYESNSSTALEQDLAGQKFQDCRDVLTFVPQGLILHDTEFCQQGTENFIAQKTNARIAAWNMWNNSGIVSYILSFSF
jgi:hypothetical protein